MKGPFATDLDMALAEARALASLRLLIETWPMPVTYQPWELPQFDNWAGHRARSGTLTVFCSNKTAHQAGDEPRLGVLPVGRGSELDSSNADRFKGRPNEWWIVDTLTGRQELAPLVFTDDEVRDWYRWAELASPGRLLETSRFGRFPEVPDGPFEWGDGIDFAIPLPDGARPKIAFACPDCRHKVGSSPEVFAHIAVPLIEHGMKAVSLKQLDDLLMRTGQRRTRRH